MEIAENAQEEESRNPLPIDDRKNVLDDATDPKDDNALPALPPPITITTTDDRNDDFETTHLCVASPPPL